MLGIFAVATLIVAGALMSDSQLLNEIFPEHDGELFPSPQRHQDETAYADNVFELNCVAAIAAFGEAGVAFAAPEVSMSPTWGPILRVRLSATDVPEGSFGTAICWKSTDGELRTVVLTD